MSAIKYDDRPLGLGYRHFWVSTRSPGKSATSCTTGIPLPPVAVHKVRISISWRARDIWSVGKCAAIQSAVGVFARPMESQRHGPFIGAEFRLDRVVVKVRHTARWASRR
jgi:hypothetical protein